MNNNEVTTAISQGNSLSTTATTSTTLNTSANTRPSSVDQRNATGPFHLTARNTSLDLSVSTSSSSNVYSSEFVDDNDSGAGVGSVCDDDPSPDNVETMSEGNSSDNIKTLITAPVTTPGSGIASSSATTTAASRSNASTTSSVPQTGETQVEI